MTLSIFHSWFDSAIAFFHAHPLARREQISEAHEAVLGRARQALRAGRVELAATLVEELDESGQRNPACLNILGLIAEARDDWVDARRCWGKALRLDPSYVPAYDNLRRWFELAQLGSTRTPIAYGDNDLPAHRHAYGKRK